jgi:hypothetical protein
VPTIKWAGPSHVASRGTNSKKYSAVSIAASGDCCPAVREHVGRKLLATDAPRLPLAACAHPLQCTCRFRKYADRRDEDDEDRRSVRNEVRPVWYSGAQRRKSPGRRGED